MPMVRVERDYRFEGPDGERSLSELFDGRSRLILYRFYFEEGEPVRPHAVRRPGGGRGCARGLAASAAVVLVPPARRVRRPAAIGDRRAVRRHLNAERRPERTQSSEGSKWLTVNTAPWGSASTAMRTARGVERLDDDRRRRARRPGRTMASVSPTANVTPQRAGSPVGGPVHPADGVGEPRGRARRRPDARGSRAPARRGGRRSPGGATCSASLAADVDRCPAPTRTRRRRTSPRRCGSGAVEVAPVPAVVGVDDLGAPVRGRPATAGTARRRGR